MSGVSYRSGGIIGQNNSFKLDDNGNKFNFYTNNILSLRIDGSQKLNINNSSNTIGQLNINSTINHICLYYNNNSSSISTLTTDANLNLNIIILLISNFQNLNSFVLRILTLVSAKSNYCCRILTNFIKLYNYMNRSGESAANKH